MQHRSLPREPTPGHLAPLGVAGQWGKGQVCLQCVTTCAQGKGMGGAHTGSVPLCRLCPSLAVGSVSGAVQSSSAFGSFHIPRDSHG